MLYKEPEEVTRIGLQQKVMQHKKNQLRPFQFFFFFFLTQKS
jgi:hypothetical protein